MKHNSLVIDITHGLIHFPQLTMQVKSAASETSATPQGVCIHDKIKKLPMRTETITAFVDHPSKWNTTGTVTPVEEFTETVSLLISHSMSTINETGVTVRVTNTTESPHTIKKNAQIADISVVTPEQSKLIKQVDTANLSVIQDLTFYLSELIRTIKPKQKNNTFCFSTPKNPAEFEDHSPIQTRILKQLNELMEEKIELDGQR